MKNNNKNNLKYVIYARKSSEAKDRQVASLSDRLSECNKYALKNSLEIVKTFTESKSAYKPNNRPEFNKMIEMVRKKKANAIILWKPDRLSRNPEEGGKVHQMLLDGFLKEIRTPQNDIYTPESSQIILSIHLGMANEYSRALSQNVKRGLKYKAERGEYTRSAPLGYEGYGRERQRLIRPHPIKGELIKKLFRLASTGKHSLKQLREIIFTDGLTSKSGKKISKSYLHRMLQNSMYYGYFVHDGEMYEGVYEPLISKSLFDHVQLALSNRSKPRKYNWNEHKYLNGLISCDECGCSVTTTVKKKYYKLTNRTAYYVYHHCTKRKIETCSQKILTHTEVQNQIISSISKLKISYEDWKLAIKLARAKHINELKQYSKMKTYYKKKLKLVLSKKSKLVKLRMNEELTKEEFSFEKKLLMNEEAHLKEVINSDEMTLADHWLERTEDFFKKAFESGETIRHGEPEEQRDLILSVGQNLYLNDGNIDIQFKKPYDALLKPKYRSSMQGQRESNPRQRFWRPLFYH